MTPTTAQSPPAGPGQPLFDLAAFGVADGEPTDAITAEYAEAMHHLIEPDTEELPFEKGTSEYCDASAADVEADDEISSMLLDGWS